MITVQTQITYADLLKKIQSHKNRVFFVSAKSYNRSNIETKLSIYANDIIVTRFSQFDENPTFEEVMQGVKLFKQAKTQLIIALGGGTAIDLAKLIKYYAYNELDGTEIVPPKPITNNTDIELVAIPTTFGTGSESTHFAVLYINANKFSIAASDILPNSYILDSSYALTLPLQTKGCACLDALCQAIESYWSISRTTQSCIYAKDAIRKIIKYYEIYISSPTTESIVAIADAANLAGRAINITKTTAPHALSYTLTSKFNVAHGHAVALCIRNMFEINTKKIKVVKHILDQDIMNELYKILNVKNGQEAKALINYFMQLSNLATKFIDVGLYKSEDIALVVNNVNLERLENHPVPLQEIDLKKLLVD